MHIIEQYFRLVKHWLTMTNIRLSGGKEIDLLGFDPKTKGYHHVEARVTTALPMRLRETFTTKGRGHKDGLDYFVRESLTIESSKKGYQASLEERDTNGF